MDEISICGLCRAPIQNGHGGLRHFGTFTAHQEYECLRILHARIAELERERDVARAEIARLTTLRPMSEWHEDDGLVLWWNDTENNQFPFFGYPSSIDWPWHSFKPAGWTPIPEAKP